MTEQLLLFEEPEKLNKYDSHLYKSSIQKGYRRNDWRLFKESFDALWYGGFDDWVLWRAMVFPAEDSWLSVKNVGKAVRKATGLHKGSPEEARKVLLTCYKQELAKKKNQDSNGLANWVTNMLHYKPDVFSIEALAEQVDSRYCDITIQLADYRKRYLEDVSHSKGAIWSEVWEVVNKLTDIDAKNEKEFIEAGAPQEYMDLRDTVGALYFRARKDNRIDYQILFLAGSLLAIDAYNKGEPLSASNSSSFYDTTEYQTWHDLPWFCIDMHTGKGKQILSYLRKKYTGRFDDFQLQEIWFLNSVARVNETCERSQVWGALKETVYLDAHFMQSEWTEMELTIKKLLREDK